jgi:hypothetical protein
MAANLVTAASFGLIHGRICMIHHKREFTAIPATHAGELAFGLIDEVAPAGDAGEMILVGPVLQFLLQPFAFGDISAKDQNASDGPRYIFGHHLDPVIDHPGGRGRGRQL